MSQSLASGLECRLRIGADTDDLPNQVFTDEVYFLDGESAAAVVGDVEEEEPTGKMAEQWGKTRSERVRKGLGVIWSAIL